MSSSSLYQPRPVLSSQRFSPGPDYVDNRRSFYGDSGRLPLRESTGNVNLNVNGQQQQQHQHEPQQQHSQQQHSGFGGLVSCYSGQVNLSPSMQSNLPPAAPIVPSQSFDCLQRLDTTGPRHHHHHPIPPPLQQPRYPQRKSRNDINPLYFWPAFRQYRNRQAHKDTQKDKGGVWRRPELEDAFVDSVLLMPHMGRRKFSMGGKLHGRNMLISEYIFVICVAILGSKEIFRIDNSNDSIEQMGRKQVSSHMQVVKKFFEDLRCFHFLFPSEEKKEPGTTNSDDFYEEEEQESFKSNPVLTALAEGRVPEVKPNYEYFSQLLALQSSITVRPKTVEVFVSSPDVKIRDDVAYDANDTPLDQASFPHLNKYMNCDDTPNVLGKDVLLHEYTRSLDRTTSACVKSVTRRWQKDAPAMCDTLDLPTRDEDCLLLEMCSTVDLHEHAKFPSGSELTGFVEVALTQPALQNHRWKCVTRLTRPPELHSDEGKPEVYTNESGIHRRGCSDSRQDCDCHMRPRQDIHVPFPAVEWASILSTAVQYPDVEHQRKKEKRGNGSKKGGDLERVGSKRKRSEDEGDAAAWTRREPTGSDLICKVAMYQELWSCAPDSTRWTRQAILFWRFSTTNQWYKYNPVFRPAGTTWKWLTVNDPMSRYHQQKALVYPTGAGNVVSRDNVMSPTPSVNQHLTAAMNETFNSWDNGNSGGGSNVALTQVPAGNGNMALFDSFPNGLATPPPTASLHGSYSASGSFDATNGFLTSGCGPSDGQTPGLASGQQYFDGPHGPQAVVTTFADVKPMSAAVGVVGSYMGGGPAAPLDLSNGSLVYDTSAHAHAHHHHHNPHQHHHQQSNGSAGLQGWDMTPLDSWTGTPTGAPTVTPTGSDWGPPSAGAPAPKMEHPGMWNPTHWAGHVPNTATTSSGRDGSPPPMKRRRGDMLDGNVPVTAGW